MLSAPKSGLAPLALLRVLSTPEAELLLLLWLEGVAPTRSVEYSTPSKLEAELVLLLWLDGTTTTRSVECSTPPPPIKEGEASAGPRGERGGDRIADSEDREPARDEGGNKRVLDPGGTETGSSRDLSELRARRNGIIGEPSPTWERVDSDRERRPLGGIPAAGEELLGVTARAVRSRNNAKDRENVLVSSRGAAETTGDGETEAGTRETAPGDRSRDNGVRRPAPERGKSASASATGANTPKGDTDRSEDGVPATEETGEDPRTPVTPEGPGLTGELPADDTDNIGVTDPDGTATPEEPGPTGEGPAEEDRDLGRGVNTPEDTATSVRSGLTGGRPAEEERVLGTGDAAPGRAEAPEGPGKGESPDMCGE